MEEKSNGFESTLQKSSSQILGPQVELANEPSAVPVTRATVGYWLMRKERLNCLSG